MPSPHDLPSLLLSLFSDSELRRLVRWGPNGRDLEARLPGRHVSPAELASAVADLYEREGLLPDLPQMLLTERPRRSDDIHVVFEQLRAKQLAASAPTSAPPPTGSPQLPGTLSRSITGMPWDLFLVHSAQDKRAVHEVFGVVAPNVRTFLDDQLPPGIPWDATINRALHESAVIGVLASKATWADSFYQRAEVQSAIGLARATHDWIRVVPLHLDGLPAAASQQIYGLNLLSGIVVSPQKPLAEAARELQRVVLHQRPLHRLASLLQLLFPSPDKLAAWISTVPVVDRLNDRAFRVEPRSQPPEPWRQAVRQLHDNGRTDPARPVLFDLLRKQAGDDAELVDEVQAAFVEARRL